LDITFADFFFRTLFNFSASDKKIPCVNSLDETGVSKSNDFAGDITIFILDIYKTNLH